MKIETLRKRALANTLEVEHILAAARERAPGLRHELTQLSDKHGWSTTPFPANGIHVVPLAKWAEIASVYAEGGIPHFGRLPSKKTITPLLSLYSWKCARRRRFKHCSTCLRVSWIPHRGIATSRPNLSAR